MPGHFRPDGRAAECQHGREGWATYLAATDTAGVDLGMPLVRKVQANAT